MMFKMSYFIYFIKLAVSTYAAILLVTYFFQRKFLYYPSKEKPNIDSFRSVYSEVQVPAGVSLLHWNARRGLPYIVILHGNAGHIESRAAVYQFLAEQGYSVFLMSYRGYGGNPGTPSEKNIVLDASLTLDWLVKKENISAKDIVLLGESLGSGPAVFLAGKYPVKALIIESGFSSVADVGQSAYPFLPVKLLLKDSWNSFQRIKRVSAPSLFIHAKKDPVVPFRFGEKLFSAAEGPKKSLWLERRGHADNLNHPSVKASVLDFLRSLE